MGKIKGIIRLKWMETSMLHLHVSIKGVPKISPPPPPPPPLPWRWGMRSEEKLFAKWFQVMPNFRKVIVFSLTRGTYTNMSTEILPPLPLNWVQTSPPPPTPRHLKIRLVRPSLTFLGHHTLLIWQDWLVFTAVFSVTSIYLENATTPPPWVQNCPPRLGSIANIVQQPKYYYCKIQV